MLTKNLRAESLFRILAIMRKEAREILEEAGGVEALGFPRSYLEAHFNLPLPLRNKLLPHIEACKAAVATVSPAQKIILNSPSSAPLTIALQSVDLSQIDNSKRLKQQARLELYRRQEARYHHLVQTSPKIIAICDRTTLHLDCNFKRRKVGFEREEVIGRTNEEFNPALAELARTVIREAFQFPEVPTRCEFTLKPLAGIPVKYRAEIRSFGDEAICIVDPISPYPWVK